MKISVQIATPKHMKYAKTISMMIETAARARGTGIAHRPPEYIKYKMKEGMAIIAIATESGSDRVAGYCGISVWDHQRFVANSGLIVGDQFRQQGLARKMKEAAYRLARRKFPTAKLFTITTSLAVMKVNSELGYQPVTFSELPHDDDFWAQCLSCHNYDILLRNHRKNCLCTAMLLDPHSKPTAPSADEMNVNAVNTFP